jgi:ATP-binding cassette subfamily B protein
VGFVFQEAFLFSETVRSNIAYGRPDADASAIERSARAARIHDYIASLEHGYDTIVGERGITLSGGQKQRMTIARAMLMDPPVLVLDDCTSSLDAVTEREIRLAMEAAARKRTTIIIAQRISTVKGADRIVVFNHGRIEQAGTHAELIGLEGVYRELFYGQCFSAEEDERPEGEAICRT